MTIHTVDKKGVDMAKPVEPREIICNFKFDSNEFSCQNDCCYKDDCKNALKDLEAYYKSKVPSVEEIGKFIKKNNELDVTLRHMEAPIPDLYFTDLAKAITSYLKGKEK